MSNVEMVLPTADTVGKHLDAWQTLGKWGVPMMALCHLLLQAVLDTPNEDPSLDERDVADIIADYLVSNTLVDPSTLSVEESVTIRTAAYDLYTTLRKLRHVLVGAGKHGDVVDAVQFTTWLGKDMVVNIRTTESGYRSNVFPR